MCRFRRAPVSGAVQRRSRHRGWRVRSAEEILFGRTDDLVMDRGLSKPRWLDAANHRDGHSGGLSHDKFRRTSELVGDTDLGDEKLSSHRVDLAAEVDDRGNAGN